MKRKKKSDLSNCPLFFANTIYSLLMYLCCTLFIFQSSILHIYPKKESKLCVWLWGLILSSRSGRRWKGGFVEAVEVVVVVGFAWLWRRACPWIWVVVVEFEFEDLGWMFEDPELKLLGLIISCWKLVFLIFLDFCLCCVKWKRV
jgi:hypothetical protein